MIDGKTKSLGYFYSEEDAARAYDGRVRKHKLNRELNFPDWDGGDGDDEDDDDARSSDGQEEVRASTVSMPTS